MIFRDRIIWITGASTGIGEALADELSQKGAKLILSARNIEKLQQVQAQCQNPQQHQVIPLDLAEIETINRAVTQVLEEFTQIDILIHCGGVSQRALAQDTDLSVDYQIMAINYFGAIALTKALLPTMLKQQFGQIVVISSIVGKFGTPLRSAYAASKHALHGFFESLQAEVYDAGIRVTMVCPGFIKTDISCHALTGEGKPHGIMDTAQAQGMDVRICAQKIVKAIQQQKPEVLIGGKELLGVDLKRFFPGLFRYLIRRSKVT
ncbi:MAG: SDR family oxidoreductase [Jaaginema sp. PMC 1079.18]|nr:SDR family oxidoreductase [Jaaginema sp. PMC 1080.18]MEC4851986.1 SDR family oxidoreductase [Jaaginema sp. PMC 1079.18]MEC4868682.1 SDR family oxidoreductase [Jaaginema sp. PMC 1078.18]